MKHAPEAVLCLTLFALAPAAAAPAKAAPAAALLQKIQKATAAAKTLTATLAVSLKSEEGQQNFAADLQLMRPLTAVARLKNPRGELFQSIYVSGEKAHIVVHDEKQFLEAPMPGGEMIAGIGLPVHGFFDPAAVMPPGRSKLKGFKTVGGRKYRVVEVAKGSQPREEAATLYVGPSYLIEGAEQKTAANQRISFWLKQIKTGVALTPAQLAFAPPAGYSPFEPPSFDKDLLPVGQMAPDFDLPTPDGARMSLTQARQGKKAVLLNFWFYG